jgi:hypothetical protein
LLNTLRREYGWTEDHGWLTSPEFGCYHSPGFGRRRADGRQPTLDDLEAQAANAMDRETVELFRALGVQEMEVEALLER